MLAALLGRLAWDFLQDSSRDSRSSLWGSLSAKRPLVTPQGAFEQLRSDVNGIKPIHWGATQGHTSVVKALLAGKADASATDSYGQTAAQLADASGRQEVRKLLMIAEATFVVLEPHFDRMMLA